MKYIVFKGQDNKRYEFWNVTKLTILGNETTIGYYDEDEVYHEETNDTPIDIHMYHVNEQDLILTMIKKIKEE